MADKPMQNPGKEPPKAAEEPKPGAEGRVDTDAIKAKMNILPKFQELYETLMVRGLKIAEQFMFPEAGRPSFIDSPKPPAEKLAEGVITIVYLLWTQSNKTFDPRLVVPVTFGLTLDIFDKVQISDPEEFTAAVLGDAMEKSIGGVMQKFGVQPEQAQQVIQQYASTLKSAGASPADTAAAAKPA